MSCQNYLPMIPGSNIMAAPDPKNIKIRHFWSRNLETRSWSQNFWYFNDRSGCAILWMSDCMNLVTILRRNYVCFTQGHGSWSSRVFCPSVTQTDIQWMVHITQTSIESIKHFHLFVREKERGCLFWCVKKNVSGGTVWKAEKLFWMEKNQFVTHTPKFSQYKCQGMIYWK